MGARGREHFVSPAVIDVLDGKMGLVGAVVAACSCEAISQRLELLQPVGPLSLTLV